MTGAGVSRFCTRSNCPGRAGPDECVIHAELRAEIEAFLEVGRARGQLAADGEIPAPSATAQAHADLELPKNWRLTCKRRYPATRTASRVRWRT
jgi:hypothetical protein